VNVIGFDDGPVIEPRADVILVGAVCARTRLDGVVSGRVRRDGSNATSRMIELVRASQFRTSVRAVLLQGIAVAGFNVVDVHALSGALGVPVLVVVRKPPDLASVRRALFARVPGAARKWALIERAGTGEPLGVSHRAARRAAASGLRDGAQRIWIQRVGLSVEEARELVAATTLHGHIPEPLRLAHLIAGGITTGASRGRT
jgi:endonuclease V-like protein UPF0215 family